MAFASRATAVVQTTGGTASDDSNVIVVTGSKREEKLKDAPAAIMAISGDTLARIGALSFREYSTLVPGLSLRDFGNPGAA